mmetsp:Transcript_39565/g.95591  ORF Transcript_39565/g.95591 Transcript_39565/m.95591 type:complete len:233 (-) Transcript_39565:112-810(-)
MSSLQRALLLNKEQPSTMVMKLTMTGRPGTTATDGGSTRSAAAAAVGTTASKDTTNGNKGHFENCFAQGLDLSEFDQTANDSDRASAHSNATRTAIPSASANLLRIKEIEQQQKLHDEMEERRLEQSVQRRISNISQSMATKKININDKDKQKKSTSINDVLVHMHYGLDADFIGGLAERRGSHQVAKKQKKEMKNNLKKQQQQQKRTNNNQGTGKTKQHVVKGKSSRRMKY